MSQKANPFIFNDLSRGVYRRSAVGYALMPSNSVQNAINVNFDTTIGAGVVRPGTTLLGTTIASNKTPLGLSEFTPGSAYKLVAVFSGATAATIYYYYNGWNASIVTSLSNTTRNRFAELGGRIYRVSDSLAMTSSADGNTWDTTNCITTDNVVPSLIYRTKARLIASGYSTQKSRVYFSSIIDPNSSPTLTWDTTPTTGDYIDVNPDDGSDVTGFAETSSYLLVFKGKGMYRMGVIDKSVTPDNIFNIGAVSQEAITVCAGVCYFFSGQDIRRTVGDFPEQISRLGVQDFIDAIPQSNWYNVSCGNDGFNVYFSIGNVTINNNRNEQKTYNNVVLKFSTRDETWSVHSYANSFKFFSQFTTTAGRTLIGATTAGDVQTLNSGTTDNSSPIYYELETQEIDFGNRATFKAISDDIVVFTKNGQNGYFEVLPNGMTTTKTLKGDMTKRVAKMENAQANANYFTFRWHGESVGTPPVFEGFYIQDVISEGIK
jgi:hypothetical protein